MQQQDKIQSTSNANCDANCVTKGVSHTNTSTMATATESSNLHQLELRLKELDNEMPQRRQQLAQFNTRNFNDNNQCESLRSIGFCLRNLSEQFRLSQQQQDNQITTTTTIDMINMDVSKHDDCIDLDRKSVNLASTLQKDINHVNYQTTTTTTSQTSTDTPLTTTATTTTNSCQRNPLNQVVLQLIGFAITLHLSQII